MKWFLLSCLTLINVACMADSSSLHFMALKLSVSINAIQRHKGMLARIHQAFRDADWTVLLFGFQATQSLLQVKSFKADMRCRDND